MVGFLLRFEGIRDGIMILTYFINFQGNWNVPTGQKALHLAAYFNFPLVLTGLTAPPTESSDAQALYYSDF